MEGGDHMMMGIIAGICGLMIFIILAVYTHIEDKRRDEFLQMQIDMYKRCNMINQIYKKDYFKD
jgi:hypothetical protein